MICLDSVEQHCKASTTQAACRLDKLALPSSKQGVLVALGSVLDMYVCNTYRLKQGAPLREHHNGLWQFITCMPIDTTAQYLSSDLTLASCTVSLIKPYVLPADTILSGPANKSALRAASLRLRLNEGEPFSDPNFPLLYWPSFSLPFTLRSLALFSSVCMLPSPYTNNYIGRRAQICQGLLSISPIRPGVELLHGA